MSQDFPTRRARMEYVCMNCGHRHPVDALLYTCPDCGGVLLLEDLDFDDMKARGAQYWRDLFDARRATRTTALRGVFRFFLGVFGFSSTHGLLYREQSYYFSYISGLSTPI